MLSKSLRFPTETRRAEIVGAALHLAQSRSPESITTTDLACAVGLSQGALFKHFATKDAVWLAAMAWVSEHLLLTLNEAAQQDGTPLDALRGVFDAHIQFVVAYPGVPRLIFHELQKPMGSPLKQQVCELMNCYRQLLLRLLLASVQQGESAPDLDAPAAATLLIGIVQGLVMQSMLSGEIATIKTQASCAFHLYLHGILKTQ
jgi:TetR/AcrR family transcriptional regulator